MMKGPSAGKWWWQNGMQVWRPCGFIRYLIPYVVLFKAEVGMGRIRQINGYPSAEVEVNLEKSVNKSIKA